MCVVVYKAFVLLALVLSCTAELTPQQCENLTTALPASDVNKIYGNWVLVEGMADYEEGLELMLKLTSSYVELFLDADNNTVHYHERNTFLGGSCVRYYMNTTVDTSNASVALHDVSYLREAGEVQTQRTSDPDKVFFYQTFCPDCLTMIYQGMTTGTMGRYLLFLRREGKHQNVEELTAAQESNRKQAECLKFEVARHFIYNGKTEFCPKKEEEKGEEPKEEVKAVAS